MGNLLSKKTVNKIKPILSNNLLTIIPNFTKQISITKMYLIIDFNGIIIDTSDNISHILFYYSDEVIGKSITIIMNDFMKYIHTIFFLQNSKDQNKSNKLITNNIIKIHNNMKAIIYDKLKNPIRVILNYSLYQNNNLYIEINLDSDFNKSNIYLYTNNLNIEQMIFKQTENNIVLITIDFIDSTILLNTLGVINTIEININFHNDIIKLIKNFYYPYIYIHEIIGDSFIIVLNTDWTYNINNYCTSIAIHFINKLYNLTNEYIQIRTGITYGKLYYGLIDHNLRFFGNIINMSTRLETNSGKKYILTNRDFLNKLKQEISLEKIEIEELNYNLKGFGDTICYKIILKDYEDMFTYSDLYQKK